MARQRSRGWNELEAVTLLQSVLGVSHAGVAVAIGDDAAVLQSPRGKLISTVDVAVQGVHFDRRWLTLTDIGFRSFNAAASDLGAMGARPLGALSSLILPKGFEPRELRELAEGQADAARRLKCPVVGGNLARGSELSVTTTVMGEARKPLLRSTAREGDELWLIGNVGLATAGLRLLAAGSKAKSHAVQRCIEAWRRPLAQLEMGAKLVARAHAAIDVSDGLGCDVTRLAHASQLRVIVEAHALEATLTSDLMQVAATLGVSALDLALSGGEDYAILAAGTAAKRPRFAARIGHFERGKGAKLELANGRRVELPSGFDHLAR
jgi:thiamine-monophosphate kinase